MRKLQIDNVPECRDRMARAERALADIKWAAFELKHAGAMRAHARVRGCIKSVQGAFNHARARFRAAERVAAKGCDNFYEGSLGRCVHCNLQLSAHKGTDRAR